MAATMPNAIFRYFRRMKHWLALCLLAASLNLGAQEQGWSHKACIWRGMRHSWTYNHRCNRLGDYITQRGDSFFAVHTSATGKGADSTFFDSYYSLVESPDVWFRQGSESFEMFGVEGALLEQTNEVLIPIPDDICENAFLTALVNGFDILSLSKADKLQLLSISIEKPELLTEQHKLRLLVKISMVDNCQSLECDHMNNKTGYSITIHYIVACGNKKDIFENQDFSNRSYTWDKKIINGALNETRTIQGAHNSYSNAVIGIQSFGFALNKAHWLLEFDNNIQPHQYNPVDGVYTYDIEQSFVEWEEGMKKFSAVPEQSKYSLKQKGWINMDMDIVFLQLRNAKVQHGEASGSMFWEGRNESANTLHSTLSQMIKK